MSGRPSILVGLVGMVGLVLTIGAALPAAAGGSWLAPARDRYEPGDEATLVGYTGGGQLGWVEDGPFYGYLRVDPVRAVGEQAEDPERWPIVTPSDLPVGPMVLQETGHGGYLNLRAAITFEIPADLAPNRYDFLLCNDPCTTGLGDFIGGTLWVGVDPDHPVSRYWPANDPALWGAPASVGLPAPPPTTAPPTTTTVPFTFESRASEPRPDPLAAPTTVQPVVGAGRDGHLPTGPVISGAAVIVVVLAAVTAYGTRRRGPALTARTSAIEDAGGTPTPPASRSARSPASPAGRRSGGARAPSASPRAR